jgi:hypothetical protein
MIDWFVLGLGVPSQQKFFRKGSQMAQSNVRVLRNADECVLVGEVHKALCAVNTLAKMICILEPEDIVRCYVLTKHTHLQMGIHTWQQLASSIRNSLSILESSVFDQALINTINDNEFDEACKKIFDELIKK